MGHAASFVRFYPRLWAGKPAQICKKKKSKSKSSLSIPQWEMLPSEKFWDQKLMSLDKRAHPANILSDALKVSWLVSWFPLAERGNHLIGPLSSFQMQSGTGGILNDTHDEVGRNCTDPLTLRPQGWALHPTEINQDSQKNQQNQESKAG